MIFGTDGIRGRMGVPPLDGPTIRKLSRVIGAWLGEGAPVVIGRDTRASSQELAAWITGHLGPRLIADLGVVPTPTVAYETKARGARLGIMITASHNPAGDNGLKFFDSLGLKIPYSLAWTWSAAATEAAEPPPGPVPPTTPAAPDHYRSLVLRHFLPADFSGLRLGFDLANGATVKLIPEITGLLGIEATFLAANPDGFNINRDAGAMHPGTLASMVKGRDLDFGFAFDGDGDRLVLVAPDPVHGDIVLYVLAHILQREGIPITTLAGTIMCGLGLERCLRAEGVDLLRTPVGDQNVLAEMVARDLPLGGEPSGHLIQADLFAAGDGFLAALRLARGLRRHPDLLPAARERVAIYPYYEKALPVLRKPPLATLPDLQAAIGELRDSLSTDGRLIVRYSGTEPKLRVFLEAPDLAPPRAALTAIEKIIARQLT